MPGTASSGRKGAPTALKLLRGNPGRRPLPANEPKPRVMLPKPPAHLGEVEVAEWWRMGRMLVRLGIMTELDSVALAAYCQVYGRWVEASEAAKKYGTVLVDAKSSKLYKSPYLQIATEAWAQMVRMLVELGATPVARPKVTAQPKPTKADPMEAMLGG